MMYLLKHMWFYIVVFILLITLFVCYPFCIEELIYEKIYSYVHLLPYNLSDLNKSNILSEIMKFIPLFYISVIGLIVSLINTIAFCIIDINDEEKKWNIFLTLCAIIITVYTLWVVEDVFDDMKISILKYHDDYNNLVKSVFDNYNFFSENVIRITFITFFLFLGIDIKDIHFSKKRSLKLKEETSQIQKNDLEKKYSRLQLWLIDLPVIFVAIFIYFYEFDESILPLELTKGHIFQNVFCAGAWGIQIIYSQIVFFVLMFFYYNEKKQLT